MCCAVLGHLIDRSLSPTLYSAGYVVAGLYDATYDAVRVPDDGLGQLVAGLDESWRWLWPTMLHKRGAVVLRRNGH